MYSWNRPAVTSLEYLKMVKSTLGHIALQCTKIIVILTQILFLSQVAMATDWSTRSQHLLESEYGQISFTMPGNWKVLHSYKKINGGHTISVATPETTTVSLDIYSKQEIESFKISLQNFSSIYNRQSNTFSKLATKKSQPSISEARRGQYIGFKETAELYLADIDISYVKEFYQVSINDTVVFVVFDANKQEFPRFTNDFTAFLGSITYR